MRSWEAFFHEYEKKRAAVYGVAGQTRLLNPDARSTIMESVDYVATHAGVEWRLACATLLDIWFAKPGHKDALINDKHALRHLVRDCGDVAVDAVKRLGKPKGPRKTKPSIEPPELYNAETTAQNAKRLLDQVLRAGGSRRPDRR